MSPSSCLRVCQSQSAMTSGRLKLQFISRCRLDPLSALRRRSQPPCFLVPIVAVENLTGSEQEQPQQIDAMMRAMDGLANTSTWPPGCRLVWLNHHQICPSSYPCPADLRQNRPSPHPSSSPLPVEPFVIVNIVRHTGRRCRTPSSPYPSP